MAPPRPIACTACAAICLSAIAGFLLAPAHACLPITRVGPYSGKRNPWPVATGNTALSDHIRSTGLSGAARKTAPCLTPLHRHDQPHWCAMERIDAVIVGLLILADCNFMKVNPGQPVVSASDSGHLRTTVRITIDTCSYRTLFQLPCTKFRHAIWQRIPLSNKGLYVQYENISTDSQAWQTAAIRPAISACAINSWR